MTIDGSESISVDDLFEGMVCPCDFVDSNGLLLIAADVDITASLIANLRARGVKALHPRRSGRVAKRPPPKRRAATNWQTADPGAISSQYDAAKVQRIKKQFLAGERALVQLSDSFQRNHVGDLRDTESHIENYINELADDPDPVVANALKYQADLELARRSVQFSILALAIAQQMDVAAEETLAIGSAALIHDWGLFRMPPESRFPHQIKDNQHRLEYLRHPIVAEEMLQYVDGVSPAVMLFVGQVHELLDGTGFPRGLKANELPVGSRILAIADAYLTMTCAPAGSIRIVPCDAIAYLISAASQGRYSASAVTGLLKAVTLYPIGSIVELSDTTKARVIRSNGNDYGYPIVETLSRPFRVINLKEVDLFVTRPVTSTRYNEVRLPETYTELSQALSRS